MEYLDSAKIRAFPTAYRGAGIDPTSFRTTEEHLNELSTLALYHRSFIKETEDGLGVYIIINGYIFFIPSKSDLLNKFNNTSEYSPGSTIIYAYIYTKNITVATNLVTPILGNITSASKETLDDNSQFQGVGFSLNATEIINEHEQSGFPIYVWTPLGFELIEKSLHIIDVSQICQKSGSTEVNIASRFETHHLSTSSIHADYAIDVQLAETYPKIQIGASNTGADYGSIKLTPATGDNYLQLFNNSLVLKTNSTDVIYLNKSATNNNVTNLLTFKRVINAEDKTVFNIDNHNANSYYIDGSEDNPTSGTLVTGTVPITSDTSYIIMGGTSTRSKGVLMASSSASTKKKATLLGISDSTSVKTVQQSGQTTVEKYCQPEKVAELEYDSNSVLTITFKNGI